MTTRPRPRPGTCKVLTSHGDARKMLLSRGCQSRSYPLRCVTLSTCLTTFGAVTLT